MSSTRRFNEAKKSEKRCSSKQQKDVRTKILSKS